MHPKSHFIIGVISAILITLVFDLSWGVGLIIFLGSIFIDLDHAIRYSIKTGDFNPFRFWRWSMRDIKKKRSIEKAKRKDYVQPIYIFHGIEAWLIFLIVGYWYSVFLWILLGMIVHIVSDHIDIYVEKEPHDFKLSILWTLLKNKSRKNI